MESDSPSPSRPFTAASAPLSAGSFLAPKGVSVVPKSCSLPGRPLGCCASPGRGQCLGIRCAGGFHGDPWAIARLRTRGTSAGGRLIFVELHILQRRDELLERHLLLRWIATVLRTAALLHLFDHLAKLLHRFRRKALLPVTLLARPVH